jgi:hypothetical protein
VVVLQEGEVVESIFVFLDVEFEDGAVECEEALEFVVDDLFGLAAFDVGDEDLTGLLDRLVGGLALGHWLVVLNAVVQWAIGSGYEIRSGWRR